MSEKLYINEIVKKNKELLDSILQDNDEIREMLQENKNDPNELLLKFEAFYKYFNNEINNEIIN